LSIVQLIFLHCSCGKCGLWNVAIDQILCTREISLGVLRGEGFPRGETLKSGYTHCLPQPTSLLPLLPPLSQQQTNATYPRPPARQLGNMASACFFSGNIQIVIRWTWMSTRWDSYTHPYPPVEETCPGQLTISYVLQKPPQNPNNPPRLIMAWAKRTNENLFPANVARKMGNWAIRHVRVEVLC